jgi:hypothetical protein
MLTLKEKKESHPDMRKIILYVLLLLHGSLSTAANIPEQIKTCMAKNLPEDTSVQSIELRARDRAGYEKILQADVYWKRDQNRQSRVLMYFNEPVDVRGARFLIIQNEPQNDMYIYMPGLFKVRKITSKRISTSILGTDFSYEDYERLYGILTDLKLEQYPDDVLNGRPVHVLNSYPDGNSGYEKISTYVDTETCLALKTELFERGHRLRKSLTIDPAVIKPVGNINVPRELLMKDLRDETETRMIIRDIRLGMPLEDDLFDPAQLKQKKAPPIMTE